MQTQRRTQGLLIEELPEETIVYDTTRHEVHCLNRAATLVWHHCDGRTSPAELAELLRKELDLSADEALVRLILEQLDELHLLEKRSARPAVAARRTRREAARQLAGYGIATALILTIASPTPAMAASPCHISGFDCNNNSTCCSQCCAGTGCHPSGPNAGKCK